MKQTLRQPDTNLSAAQPLLALLAKIVIRIVSEGLDSPGPGKSDPAWVGQKVRIEDLPDFKARHGLQTVRIEWPEGSSCLVGTMVQQDAE